MSRIQLACYSLVASAFILAGLLVAQHDQQKASGAMVIDREDFALMTTQTRPNEEALFVIDNSTGYLLIYRVGSGQVQLAWAGNLNRFFGGGGQQQQQQQQRGSR